MSARDAGGGVGVGVGGDVSMYSDTYPAAESSLSSTDNFSRLRGGGDGVGRGGSGRARTTVATSSSAPGAVAVSPLPSPEGSHSGRKGRAKAGDPTPLLDPTTRPWPQPSRPLQSSFPSPHDLRAYASGSGGVAGASSVYAALALDPSLLEGVVDTSMRDEHENDDIKVDVDEYGYGVNDGGDDEYEDEDEKYDERHNYAGRGLTNTTAAAALMSWKDDRPQEAGEEDNATVSGRFPSPSFTPAHGGDGDGDRDEDGVWASLLEEIYLSDRESEVPSSASSSSVVASPMRWGGMSPSSSSLSASASSAALSPGDLEVLRASGVGVVSFLDQYSVGDRGDGAPGSMPALDAAVIDYRSSSLSSSSWSRDLGLGGVGWAGGAADNEVRGHQQGLAKEPPSDLKKAASSSSSSSSGPGDTGGEEEIRGIARRDEGLRERNTRQAQRIGGTLIRMSQTENPEEKVEVEAAAAAPHSPRGGDGCGDGRDDIEMRAAQLSSLDWSCLGRLSNCESVTSPGGPVGGAARGGAEDGNDRNDHNYGHDKKRGIEIVFDSDLNHSFSPVHGHLTPRHHVPRRQRSNCSSEGGNNLLSSSPAESGSKIIVVSPKEYLGLMCISVNGDNDEEKDRKKVEDGDIKAPPPPSTAAAADLPKPSGACKLSKNTDNNDIVVVNRASTLAVSDDIVFLAPLSTTVSTAVDNDVLERSVPVLVDTTAPPRSYLSASSYPPPPLSIAMSSPSLLLPVAVAPEK